MTVPVCKVQCPSCGDVLVHGHSIIIDDEDDVYRFTCPGCASVIDKQLTEQVRDILRSAGIATLDEHVEGFAGLLANDSNIWRGLLT